MAEQISKIEFLNTWEEKLWKEMYEFGLGQSRISEEVNVRLANRAVEASRLISSPKKKKKKRN